MVSAALHVICNHVQEINGRFVSCQCVVAAAAPQITRRAAAVGPTGGSRPPERLHAVTQHGFPRQADVSQQVVIQVG